MKTFTVTIRYTGLTGEYTTQTDHRARTAKSAANKARQAIGNRDGYVVGIKEKMSEQEALGWRRFQETEPNVEGGFQC